jgi:predicted transcriptional regulator
VIHTSVRLSDDLQKQVRLLCAERGVSFTAFLQTAIRNEVQRSEIADMEKRIAGSFTTQGKRIDKLAEASYAGYALVLALAEELLSHIYTDPATADAQLGKLIQSAQSNAGVSNGKH